MPQGPPQSYGAQLQPQPPQPTQPPPDEETPPAPFNPLRRTPTAPPNHQQTSPATQHPRGGTASALLSCVFASSLVSLKRSVSRLRLTANFLDGGPEMGAAATAGPVTYLCLGSETVYVCRSV